MTAALKKFASLEGIKGAWFWAIGAADDIEVAFYDLRKRKYVSRRFRQRLEILNITGNIGRKGREVVLHAHGTFSRPNYSVVGGHVISCRISATCEIYLKKLKLLKRKRDPKTGLNLLA